MLAYLLLASTLVIAACGLVYELVAGALASYLIGDTITRFSTVIGVYLFAMGVGAWLAKYIRRDLLARFVQLEILVGVFGGFSAMALFAAFAFGMAFSVMLYVMVMLVGILVGMEIPIMMRILRKGGFVQSTRGQAGGYSLARPAEKIVIGHVLGVLGGRIFDSDFCG
ncbi:MAG: Rrf2 family transcriptional regulator, partial [Pseudomonadota bacterium]